MTDAHLPPYNEAYIWNCVTLTEHRRKGIFRSLVADISEAAHKTGVRRLWIGSVAIPRRRRSRRRAFARRRTFAASPSPVSS